MGVVRSAKISDLDQVHAIALSNSLGQNNKRGTKKNGFLVSNYSIEDYKNYINKHKHFYVLEAGEEICGFLLGHTKDELDKSLKVNKKILEHADDDFVVIKQICIGKDHFRKGYATELYKFFIEAVERDIYLSVVLEPYNGASVKFHHSLGFDQVFDVIAEDKRSRGIFFRPHSHETIGKFDKDIILHQYEIAIDLYKHEDQLNWSKINHLFYVTSGILLLVSLAYSNFEGISLNQVMSLISTLGILSSVMFSIALRSGIIYMQERKKAVIEIEQKIISNKGVKVISSDFIHKYKLLKKSPTTIVMNIIPVFLTVLWALVLFINLSNMV